MNKGNPPLYPRAHVLIKNGERGSEESSHTLDPRTDPAFPEWSWAHLTRPEIVGESKPGLNSFTIKPIEENQNPFRLVGIIVCGVCEEEQQLKATNIRMRVPQ